MMRPGQVSVPGDIDAQVAEYVCGLLKPDEHAQVHILLSRDDRALAQALAWEERLLALVDALPRVQPDPAVRERLQRTLGIGPPPAFQPPPQPQLLRQRSREPAAPVPASGPVGHGAPPAGRAAPSRPEASAHGFAATAASATPPRQPDPAPFPEAASATPVSAMPDEAIAHSTPARSAARRSGTDAAPLPRPGPAPVSAAPQASPASPEAAGAAGGQDAARAQPAARRRARDDEPPQDDVDRRHRALVRKLWLWRLIGLCAASAAIVGFMLPGEPPPPPVQIVKVAPTRAAILQAPGTTSTPGWTATLDPQGNLMMRPLVRTEVPAGSQALLWTRSERIPEPRLLGRIDPNRPVQVPAARLGALADDQLLEITLESEGDAAEGVPHGPILFIGQMTMFGSETAAAPADGAAEDAVTSAASGAITQAGRR